MKTGTPGLVDVAVADVAAAREFYGELFGWTFDRDLDPTGSYTYAELGGVPVAGMRKKQVDAPSAWTLYLASANTRDTGKVILRHDGAHLYGPQEAEGQGVLLIAADPAGAVFGVWEQLGDWSLLTHRPGALGWAELSTPDGSTVDGFYGSVFGYEATQIGDGSTYDYQVWSVGGVPVLGRYVTAPSNTDRSQWLVYFEVAPEVGADTLVERVLRLGGSVVRPPADIPSGRVAVVRDGEGAVFALVDSSRRLVRTT